MFSEATSLIAHPTKYNLYLGGVKDEVRSTIMELTGLTCGGCRLSIWVCHCRVRSLWYRTKSH